MPILTRYSIVCQIPGAEPYTICAYNGADLSQALGITQANLPESHYGWIQECGEAFVKVSGQTQPAYADFRPNAAKRNLKEELSKSSQEQDKNPLAREALERLSQLPPLLMEAGAYCGLIREARDVFVNGHFYACVAMCGISFERFQRDKATPYGITRKHTMKQVRSILRKNKILLPETLDLCKKMADLRNDYAHGHGLNPKEDALKSLDWMHSFIDNETDLMRNYVIINGTLNRTPVAGTKT
ncbi:MAG: hypothetical protein V1753_11565 [Pseudomonadota bacterium]